MENMKKGILFSIDAALAIALVLGMFATVMLLEHSEPDKGEVGALLFTGATDDSVKELLSGGIGKDNPTATEISCKSINEYSDNGDIAEKVRQCRTLG